ncbi:hypothetical protein M2426_001271 [Pseudomonas moraviensis]|uniref:hypothetical protein n=1 Tax=Pseudomonas moraviensis TaxID=321662 RepID=UPI003D1D0203
MNKDNICNDCLDAFSVNDPVYEKAFRMNARLSCEAGCSCEQQSVSKYSPYPVEGSEEIAACVTHPHHTGNSGELTPKVLDRAFTQGLSVTRMAIEQAGMPGVVNFCRKIDKRKEPEAYSVGVITFLTSDVRDTLFHDKERAFSVFDTALRIAPEHADIVGRRYHGSTKGLSAQDKKDRNWAKQQLFDKIKSKHLNLTLS